MKTSIGAAAAAGTFELLSHTELANAVLDEATRRAKETADFLEKIEEAIDKEESK